ncbi:hypothetical protein [Sphingomonas sp. R1]|uniref:hypothetical protein n=1 Tax=Sphingomonas sp. R1 TaxID=399176 RepID=UPI0022247A9A|nr:hypothetical protein [Sphingomonas sp. R1]UYY78832.1 hypothetical protein OIM94_07580 [Sphingomonas sp. R1]
MSHDQRPARMRVVADAGAARGNAVDTKTEQNAKPGAPDAAASGGLPIVPALVFVISCMLGGAAVTYFVAGAH